MKFSQVAIALVMLGLSAQASAADTITYDCDTASNHYSNLLLPTPEGPFVVEGKLQVMNLAEIDEYSPLASLEITEKPASPGKSASEIAGFKLNVLPKSLVTENDDDKGQIQYVTWKNISQDRSYETEPFAFSEKADVVGYRLTFSAGVVSVEVGGKKKQFKTSIKKPFVSISCSTGEFLFTDLLIKPLG